jgi:hypothetical protein
MQRLYVCTDVALQRLYRLLKMVVTIGVRVPRSKVLKHDLT